MLRVRPLIHAVDPYCDVDVAGYAPDVGGWGSDAPVFAKLLNEIDARSILEVGSWKGASALHMASLQRSLGRSDTEIVCVDTWLGSLEFWLEHTDASRYGALNLVHGYPAVYYTFLCNVVAAGLQRVITPFPITSAIAARFFAHHGLSFDLVYVDGSHDYEDAIADMKGFWPLVRSGGAMFGDDYCDGWPGVMRAVRVFAEERNLGVEINDEKWIARKF
jgi:Methyltransferase domain